MRVFVTGGSGFMGRFLVPSLEVLGYDVVSPGSGECDLLRYDDLQKYSHIDFDLIFHLAAWTQAGDFCLKYPGSQWIKNQYINTNIMNFWLNDQPNAKMIMVGTSCSYDPRLPLVETNYMEGSPIESLYTYAMTKRMLYQGALSFANQFGREFLCVVPSTLYGPGYHADGRQMHFIFDLIRKIVRGKIFGEAVTLWGDGNQRRELIHVADFVKHLNRLIDANSTGLYNIGSGQDYSIREFAKLICDKVNFKFDQIEFDENRYVGARSKVLDISKISKEFPDYNNLNTPILDGISDTIDWFVDNKVYRVSNNER